MKRLKRIGSFLLGLVLTFGLCATAFAIVGDTGYSVAVTRAQTAVAFYAAMSKPEQTTVQDGFVEISGGSFTMGSPADEPERSSDEVQHRVTVGSFYLSPTEVTQKEYEAVMGIDPSGTKGR